MGRKPKLGGRTRARRNYERTKDYFTKPFKPISNIVGSIDAKKLRGIGVVNVSDLQDLCDREPKKLLKIWGFGPLKVQRICRKIGVDKSINELQKIYRKIEKKTPS